MARREPGCARRARRRVPWRRVEVAQTDTSNLDLAARRRHRDAPAPSHSRGRPLRQGATHRRAMEQGSQTGGALEAAVVSTVACERRSVAAEHSSLLPRQPSETPGDAEGNRHLVAAGRGGPTGDAWPRESDRETERRLRGVGKCRQDLAIPRQTCVGAPRRRGTTPHDYQIVLSMNGSWALKTSRDSSVHRELKARMRHPRPQRALRRPGAASRAGSEYCACCRMSA